jgi:hypothetical protein
MKKQNILLITLCLTASTVTGFAAEPLLPLAALRAD